MHGDNWKPHLSKAIRPFWAIVKTQQCKMAIIIININIININIINVIIIH